MIWLLLPALWIAWAEELYLVLMLAMAIAGLVAGILLYVLENRKSERTDDLIRDVLEIQRVDNQRISRLEMRRELEDAEKEEGEE